MPPEIRRLHIALEELQRYAMLRNEADFRGEQRYQVASALELGGLVSQRRVIDAEQDQWVKWSDIAALLAASPAPTIEGGPIRLNMDQETAAAHWAADDRLWTTQETVAFNLRTFARTILQLAASPAPAQEALEAQLAEARLDVQRMAQTLVGAKCEHHTWPLAELERLALRECPLCWKACAEDLDRQLQALRAASPALLDDLDTECDNDVGRRCKELWPTDRRSWCDGCLNTLVEPAASPAPPRQDDHEDTRVRPGATIPPTGTTAETSTGDK